MKKIRLLTSLVGLTGLSMGLVPAIASCSCSNAHQVELVSPTKERLFYTNTGGVVFNFKYNHPENIANIKVKISNLKIDGADASPVSSLLKFTVDSGGNIRVVISANIILTQWSIANSITFDLDFIDKTTKNIVETITGFSITKDPNARIVVSECDWITFSELAEQVESEKITEEAFCAKFVNDDEKQLTSLQDFIGLERTLKINGLEYKVRIVDTLHDTIAAGEELAGKKALFTFDLENLLGDSNGNGRNMFSQWHSSHDNSDYTKSVLKGNLTGESKLSGNKNVYQMLTDSQTGTPDLVGKIKTVTKEYSYKNETWQIGTYDDKLFIPTYFELSGVSTSTAPKEGLQYEYWKNKDASARVKTDLRGTKLDRWTITPCTDQTNYAWIVNEDDGVFQGATLGEWYTISFDFCI